jgi:hypothetical protein
LNSKKWNRVLTGAATISLALGTIAPAAFAATASNQYNTRTMNVGSGYTAVVNGLVAQDQGHATEFVPIYYLNQGLGKVGYTVSWDGNARVLNIKAPAGVNVTAPSAAVGTPGPNQMVIAINGTNVQVAPRVVAKDPASGTMTTYAPVYYLEQALKALGFTSTYNGQSWSLTVPPNTQANSNASLGNLTVANASSGDGSANSPAVSLTGAAMTLSTTLTDASGNPMPNVGVTFNVSNYGNYPTGYLPTVENASGMVVSGTSQSNAEQYTVFTDSTGKATVTIQGPSGSTYAYEVVATAPYAGSAGYALSSQPAYVEFVTNNDAGITPYATSSNPYAAPFGAGVPVSVILPPNAAGQPQANVLLTLEIPTNNAQFMTSAGVGMGTIIQVTTNSAGIAQTAVGAFNTSGATGNVEVTVLSSSLPSGVNAPNPTWLTFAQSGVAAKINNFSITSTTPNIGQEVVVSGQLEDASGNPVPNGQILVTSPNTGSNDFAYYNGTTTVTFPMVASASAGTLANRSYGDLVTADANGNFSFGMTDPRVEGQTYQIYAVSNGEVAGSALTQGIPNGDESLIFGTSTTLAYLSIGSFDSFVQANSNTTLTGLTASVNAGGITGNGLKTDPMNGMNGQISDIFVEPQNSANHHAGGVMNGVAQTFNVSVNNGGEIYSVNGVSLSSPASAISLSYNGGTSTVAGNKNFTVNGQSIDSIAGDQAADFELGIINGNAGATTLTVQSGSVTSTAAITFNGQQPAQVASFSPAASTINGGGAQTITFQVQDLNGNPVAANTSVPIYTDGLSSDPLFLTAVNGATLQESLNLGTSGQASYTTTATPIPFGTVPSGLNYNVSIPGVVQWTNAPGNPIYVYTGANGNVSLTLQAGGLSYPTQYTATATAQPQTPVAPPTSNGYEDFWTNTNGAPQPLYVGTSVPSSYSGFSQQGAIMWLGNGTNSTTTSSTTASTSSTTTSTGTSSSTTSTGTSSSTTSTGTSSSTTTSYFTTAPTASYVLIGADVQGVVASNVTAVNITDSTHSNVSAMGVTAAQLQNGYTVMSAQSGDTLLVTPIVNGTSETPVSIVVQ